MPLMIDAINQSGHVSARAANKAPGSVDAGRRKIESCDVLVSPECPVAFEELDGLRFETDKLGKVKRPLKMVGQHHCVDAIRYALSQTEIGDMLEEILDIDEKEILEEIKRSKR